VTEQFSDYIALTLSAGALSGDLTLHLSAGATGLPATGTFRLLVDSEIVEVTARSGPDVTVTRGTEGTTAAAHSLGAVVLPILTAAAIAQLKVDLSGGGGSFPFETNGLRPTLTTGVPVTTSDVFGAGTVYLTPFTSSQIALFTSGVWVLLSTAEVSLAITATSGKNYDVFAYNNAGTVTLEFSAAWTTDTARADALAQQDGVWVKATDHTRRWVATFRASGANITEDSAANRLFYSFYHQQPRLLLVTDTTSSWSYTTAAWRVARGNANNSFTYVTGMAYEEVEVDVMACESASSGAANMSVGVGIDSSTVNSATLYGSTGESAGGLPTMARYRGTPGLGFHTINWIEWGAAGGQFYGNVNSLGSQVAGMSGRVMA
jgi:hypothetical protein